MPITKRVNNTEKVIRDIKRGTEKGVLRGAIVLASSIQKFTPVLSGDLQSDTKPVGYTEQSINSISTVVSTDMVYGPAIEYGRPDQPGRKAHHQFQKGADIATGPVKVEIARHLPK